MFALCFKMKEKNSFHFSLLKALKYGVQFEKLQTTFFGSDGIYE